MFNNKIINRFLYRSISLSLLKEFYLKILIIVILFVADNSIISYLSYIKEEITYFIES